MRKRVKILSWQEIEEKYLTPVPIAEAPAGAEAGAAEDVRKMNLPPSVDAATTDRKTIET